jgi:outer membrane lipoprotein SlyB
MRPPSCVPLVARFALAAAMTLGAGLADAQPGPPPIPAASNGKSVNPKSGTAVTTPDDCDQCGKVVSIRETKVKEQWTPLGGGASFDSDARAATMFQIGPGLSNQGKVMVGAAGGAAYQKTPNAYEKPRWEVTVKMDNGQTRVTSLSYEPYVQAGDRVRISGRNVELIE